MDYQFIELTHWDGTSFTPASGDFIAESALTVEFKEAGTIVILRTPGLEAAHAAGYALSAGFIQAPTDILEIGPLSIDSDHIVLTLTENCRQKTAFLLSHPDIGKKVVNDLAPITQINPISAFRAFSCLEEHLHAWNHPLREKTHAAHCSTIYNAEFQTICFAEDVGRHNALDKTIGQLFLENRLSEAKLLTLSSRISHELVQKAAFAGISIVLAKARPTAAAIALARGLNITLASMDQKGGLFIFSAPERLLP